MLTTTSLASAQTPQETALARTLFQEGVALADRGDWVGAADRFDRAYSIKPTSGIAFNWARALAETGHVLHARELLLGVERDEGADPQLRRESSALLNELEPRVARVRISTDPEPSDDVVITVDGRNWPRAAWGIASPIDPGPHTVVCTEGEQERARTSFELAPGERRDIVLRLGDEGGSREEPREGRRPIYKSWALWTAVGAVVVGGVVTGVVLASSGGSEQPTPVMGNASPGVLRW